MKRRKLGPWLVLGVLLAVSPTAAARGAWEGATLSQGLDSFLEARLLESSGRYREAVKVYERALEEASQVMEVRVRFAALLMELGLAERAVEVIDVEGELDWYGRRVRALALARLAGRNPEFLEPAETALQLALEERGDDPNLELALGQVLHRLGKVEAAEEVVAGLRASRGGSPQLVAYHAGLLRELDRRQEAVELFAECAALEHPGSAECRANLIELLVELGRLGEAGEVMLRWLEEDDLDQMMRAASLLYQGGRLDQALRTVQRVLRQAPESDRGRTLEAYVLSALGRHHEAASRFRQLVREDPENIELLLALAWVIANSGDHAEARGWIERAWGLVEHERSSPDAARVCLSAAQVELQGDFTGRARDWLDRIEPSEDVGDELVAMLVETYRRDQEWNDGIAALLRLQPRLKGFARTTARAFEAEFRLRSGDSRGLRLLQPLLESSRLEEVAIALQILQGLERWQEVANAAEAALERHAEVRDLEFTRAAALERLGRIEQAEQAFRDLLESDPGDAAAANYLGYTWADRGRNLEEALELISRAVAADPDNPAYLDSLGWVHYRLQDFERAEYWLRRAVGFGDRDGTILAHLGEVLLRQGNLEEAAQLLYRALELGCDNPEHVHRLLDGATDDR